MNIRRCSESPAKVTPDYRLLGLIYILDVGHLISIVSQINVNDTNAFPNKLVFFMP